MASSLCISVFFFFFIGVWSSFFYFYFLFFIFCLKFFSGPKTHHHWRSAYHLSFLKTKTKLSLFYPVYITYHILSSIFETMKI